MTLSFRKIIILSFGAVTAAALLAMNWYVDQLARDETVVEEQRLQLIVTEQLASVLRATLEAKNHEVQQFGRFVVPHLLSKHPTQGLPRLREAIDKFQGSYRYYSWMGFADTEGVVRSASHDMLVGQNVSFRPWFQEGLRQNYTGNLHEALLLASLLKSSQSGAPLRFIDFSTPVVDEQGATLGVFATHLSFELVHEQIQAILARSGMADLKVLIVDGKGEIYYPDTAVQNAPIDVLNALMPSDNYKDLLQHDLMRVAALVYPGDSAAALDWIVVTQRPVESVTRQVSAYRGVLLVSSAIVLLMVIGCSLVLARLIYLPLQRITKWSERIVKQGLTPLPAEGLDIKELRVLEDSLVRSVEQIAAQKSALVELTENLEYKVSLRTSELSESLAELSRLHDLSGRLYATVAHELLSPVGALSMIAKSPSRWTSSRALAEGLTEQLLTTLDDMRLAINPNLPQPIRNTEIDLKDFVQSISIMAAPVVEATQFIYEASLSKNAIIYSDSWLVDAYRLRIIATNLIKNACLHSRGTRVQLIVDVEGSDLLVQVDDDGTGIDPELLERLYLPFERGDSNSHGTGMGLAIVKTWLEEIGGQIDYQRLSPGSRFMFRVPMVKVERSAESAPLDISAPDRPANALMVLKFRQKVAIVDDDSVTRVLTKALLDEYFDDVQAFESPIELLAHIDAYDLVVSDYHMPELRGDELITKARAAGFDGKLVLLTGLAAEDVEVVRSAGADDILTKPIDIDQIERLIARFFLNS